MVHEEEEEMEATERTNYELSWKQEIEEEKKVAEGCPRRDRSCNS